MPVGSGAVATTNAAEAKDNDAKSNITMPPTCITQPNAVATSLPTCLTQPSPLKVSQASSPSIAIKQPERKIDANQKIPLQTKELNDDEEDDDDEDDEDEEEEDDESSSDLESDDSPDDTSSEDEKKVE